jgi:hypothetical protein
MHWWSRHHLGSSGKELAGLTALAAALYLGATAGMAYIAGFTRVEHRLVHPDWPWLFVSAACIAVAFAGYYFAYRGSGQIEGGPDDLSHPTRLAAVSAGFGGFLAHGGSAIDEYVMRAAGASEREARVRVGLIAALEHALLTVPCIIAAAVLLVEGIVEPPRDFTIPWVIGPVVGLAAAVWFAERYRDRWRERDGWRSSVAVFLDSIHLLAALLRHPGRYPGALAGILVFWLGDMFALWAGIATFHFRMNVGSEIVAFGTAMIVTRRTAPLGGTGILDIAIPATLWYSGAPWPAAVLGTFVYRFFTVWLTMPASYAALPRLRALVEELEQRTTEEVTADADEPAIERART